MTREGGMEARRRGVPQAIYMGVLAAVLWASAGGTALAQVPDNRDLRLDPEDSVPPFYRYTLDERDQQRLDAAREAGETYLPTFQGPSTAPAAATGEPTTPRPAYEGYRTPERRAGPAPGGDRRRAGEPKRAGRRHDGLVGVLIEAWTRLPEIARVRYPGADRAAGPVEHGNAAQEADRQPGAAASGLRPEGLPHKAYPSGSGSPTCCTGHLGGGIRHGRSSFRVSMGCP